MNLQNFVKALGRLLIFGAFCLATWMGYSALQNSVAGCGPGSGCAELLDTRWATAFGIPVAFFGALVYFAAFAGRSGGPAFLRFGWVLSLWLIPIAAGWFLAIQIATGTFCKWCLITHALACAGAAMLLWLAQRDPKAESDGIVMRLGSPACALVAWFALATFQLFSVPPEPSIPIARQMVAEQVLAERHGDMVWLHGGKIKVRIKDCPSIGPKNSEQVAVALIDYACAGCRRMRGVLEDVKQKLGDEACVLYLPGVATPEGAALHRHMLVLSRIDPELHDAFARDLSAGRLIADPEALLRKIAGAVGAEAFQDAARQNVDWVDAMMASGAELQRLNEELAGVRLLPQFIAGSAIITGLDESPDNYIAAARNEALPKLGDEARAAAKQSRPVSAPVAAAPVVVENEIGPARLRVPDPIIDLGNLQPGSVVPVTVAFTNAGRAPLRVSWVQMDSGCLLTGMPDREVDQEEIGTIALELTVPESGAPANLQRQVTIHSAGGAGSSTLTLFGRITPAEVPARK